MTRMAALRGAAVLAIAAWCGVHVALKHDLLNMRVRVLNRSDLTADGLLSSPAWWGMNAVMILACWTIRQGSVRSRIVGALLASLGPAGFLWHEAAGGDTVGFYVKAAILAALVGTSLTLGTSAESEPSRDVGSRETPS